MVEVMKTMETSFKRSHAITAAGHHWPMPPPETEPDLPVSVQESPAETWVGGGLLQGRGH